MADLTSKTASSNASEVWATANEAHAIQRATAILSFSEPITSLTLKRVGDVLAPAARRAGLLKDEPINSILVEIKAGTPPQAASEDHAGRTFQDIEGKLVARQLTLATEGLRFETRAYTRWVAFKDQLAIFLHEALPVLSQSVTMKSVALEYVDLFHALAPGDADASLILDTTSPVLAQQAFSPRRPFHSHSGWFENETDGSRLLVNVNVDSTDGTGPNGLRRIVTVRTYEAEQVPDPNSPRASELTDPDVVLSVMDGLHKSLKRRLAAALTPDAQTMISLGE